MGRRRLEIADSLFSNFLGQRNKHYRISKNALPDDTKVVNVRMAFPSTMGCGVVEYLLESAEWEGPDDGELTPLLNMVITTIQTISYRQWLERQAAGCMISGVNIEWPGEEEAAKIEKEFKAEQKTEHIPLQSAAFAAVKRLVAEGVPVPPELVMTAIKESGVPADEPLGPYEAFDRAIQWARQLTKDTNGQYCPNITISEHQHFDRDWTSIMVDGKEINPPSKQFRPHPPIELPVGLLEDAKLDANAVGLEAGIQKMIDRAKEWADSYAVDLANAPIEDVVAATEVLIEDMAADEAKEFVVLSGGPYNGTEVAINKEDYAASWPDPRTKPFGKFRYVFTHVSPSGQRIFGYEEPADTKPIKFREFT